MAIRLILDKWNAMSFMSMCDHKQWFMIYIVSECLYDILYRR